MVEKQIGKIQSLKIGLGGYDNAQIGISFTLGSDKESWSVCDFWGYWATARSDSAKWSEEDREKYLGNIFMKLLALLKAAKVQDVNDLIGKPIEVTFNNMALVGWRVLEEVI